MRKVKRNKLLFSLLVFFFSLTLVNAEDLDITKSSHTIDFEELGSIKITLTEKEENIAIEGAELGLYHIADAGEKDHNLIFNYTENYKECTADLSDLTIDGLTDKITKCTKDKTPDYTKTTNEKGKLKFKDLKLGLYLVKQETQVKGYSNIDSYLVMIPKVIDNKWTYDITSEPKTEIYKTMDIKVVKVWNKQNEKTKLPEYVTIALLKNGETIDTVKLNKDNNWTHTWLDIEKSDKYTVEEINIPEGYTATYKNEEYTYIVTNTDKLPQTGQLKWPILILSITGMLFIIVGIYEMKRETNEE
jgi:hypothetical protein